MIGVGNQRAYVMYHMTEFTLKLVMLEAGW